MRYIHQKPVKAGLAKTAREYGYSSWGNDHLGLGRIHVCKTEPVIRRYTLANEIRQAISDLQLGELIIKDNDAANLGMGKRWKKIKVQHFI